MKLFLIFVVSTFSLNSLALFDKVLNGYEKSKRLELLKLDYKIAKADKDLGLSKYDWKLELSDEFSDSNLASLFSFQSQKTIRNTIGLGFKKDTFKYGTFSFSLSQTQHDTTNWQTSSFSTSTADITYEGRGTLSYNYDFLNQSKSLDWDIIQGQEQLNNAQTHVKLEKDYYDFFTAYLKAKLNVMLDRLYNESKKRAQKRVNIVQKRVNDGLSRKADLLQAKLSLETQRETIKSNYVSLREALVILEDILEFKIKESHYSSLEWSQKQTKNYVYLYGAINNKDIEFQKRQNELAQLNIDNLLENSGQSLNLTLSYTKNSFDEENSKAIGDTLGSGNRDDKRVSLLYTIPLGSNKKQALKLKDHLNKKKSDLALRNLKSNVSIQVDSLRENLSRLEGLTSISKKKIQLAKELMNEKQKLYLRGQANFDEVIQSEENYIQNQILYIQRLANLENKLGQLAFLTGNIRKYLAEYID